MSDSKHERPNEPFLVVEIVEHSHSYIPAQVGRLDAFLSEFGRHFIVALLPLGEFSGASLYFSVVQHDVGDPVARQG
jgi:hypothetical protein